MALPGIEARTAAGLCNESEEYSWGRVAKLLGVTTVEVGKWVADGELKVMDPSVTEPSFRGHSVASIARIKFRPYDPDVAKWLIDEYGLESSHDESNQSSGVFAENRHWSLDLAQSASAIIRGNGYFGHIPTCRGAMAQGDGRRLGVNERAS